MWIDTASRQCRFRQPRQTCEITWSESLKIEPGDFKLSEDVAQSLRIKGSCITHQFRIENKNTRDPRRDKGGGGGGR